MKPTLLKHFVERSNMWYIEYYMGISISAHPFKSISCPHHPYLPLPCRYGWLRQNMDFCGADMRSDMKIPMYYYVHIIISDISTHEWYIDINPITIKQSGYLCFLNTGDFLTWHNKIKNIQLNYSLNTDRLPSVHTFQLIRSDIRSRIW